MKAVILANIVPKTLHPVEDPCLITFNGQTLLLHWIRALSRLGITDMIIVANSKNYLQIQLLTAELPHDIQITQGSTKKISDEDLKSGLLSAKPYLQQEPFIFIQANQFFDTKFLELFIQRIATDNPKSLIAIKSTEDNSGQFNLNQDLNIKSIRETGANQIALAVQYFQESSNFFEFLEKNSYLDSLQQLVNSDFSIDTFQQSGFHQSLNYPWNIFALAKHFHSQIKGQGISSSAKIHGSAIISGEVIIEENVKIDANAVIKGPAYIGANTIIGVNSFIRDSYIAKDSIIGYNTEIVGSYLGSQVSTHFNSLNHSIIGSQVNFGAGTIASSSFMDSTQNRGLMTGNNIQIGVNTSFKPGVTIGSNSRLASGLLVDQHIPPDSRVSTKSSLDIKRNN